MNRNEFLKILREALKYSLENDAINAQVDYYDKYISDEIAKGKTEKEVIEELGDPRLIAKTIKTVSGSDTVIDDVNVSGSGNGNKTNNNYNSANGNTNNNKSYVYSTGGIGCVIAILLLFILVALFIRIFGYMLVGITGLTFGLGPVGILLLLIFIWLMFRRR